MHAGTVRHTTVWRHGDSGSGAVMPTRLIYTTTAHLSFRVLAVSRGNHGDLGLQSTGGSRSGVACCGCRGDVEALF